MDTLPAREASLSRRKAQRLLEKREYIIGIILLLLVVLLWTLSNFVTQVRCCLLFIRTNER